MGAGNEAAPVGHSYPNKGRFPTTTTSQPGTPTKATRMLYYTLWPILLGTSLL
jgi:hypothetical protein